ncbi:hypothetical protein BD770DRAFT_431678 [Pilaira anomala]|nr:hypothetical protein BD770DRAFT_431678 [Pilaira anomala]
MTLPKSTEKEEAMDSLTETFQKVTIAPPQKYKKYGQDQIERFIRLIQEEELTIEIIQLVERLDRKLRQHVDHQYTVPTLEKVKYGQNIQRIALNRAGREQRFCSCQIINKFINFGLLSISFGMIISARAVFV